MDKPECPEEFIYLWHWYDEVADAGGKLTYTEMRNWSDLSGNKLLPYEVDIFRKLDRIRIRVISEDV